MNQILYLGKLVEDDPVYDPVQFPTPTCLVVDRYDLAWWELSSAKEIANFQYSIEEFTDALAKYRGQVGTYIYSRWFSVHRCNLRSSLRR